MSAEPIDEPGPLDVVRKIAIAVLIIADLVFLFGYRLAGLVGTHLQSPDDAVNAPAAVVAILNLVLAAFVLYYARTLPAKSSTAPSSVPQVATSSFYQFARGWRLIWVTWICLYAWLAATWLGHPK